MDRNTPNSGGGRGPVDDHPHPIAPDRPRLRTGPIVWGALFLTFCAWIAQRAFFPDAIAPELWITFTAIGLGVILLGVGIAVGLRDRRNQGPPSESKI